MRIFCTTSAPLTILGNNRLTAKKTRMHDLAATSLPQTSPYWRSLIDNGSVAVVWDNDLKPDPKDNASLVMTYNNAGLFSKLGRVWVCWGDLRTDYVKEEVLHSKVKSQSR